ncbi:hypothetical protein EIP86_001977 [Pleurotus ostreatoroseus]|nr:hypothetical protein EIP86_001977 [Pleurotus ostreatoroseus]
MADISNTVQNKDFATKSPKCLGFDSLTALFPHIYEREDLISYISTCRDLYTAGVPHLLRFPCTIQEDNLRDFYTFLKSKAPSSFLGLRDLTCNLETLTDNSARLRPIQVEMLSEILKEARSLTALAFDAPLLLQDETIPFSIGSMASLRILEIGGAYNDQVGSVFSRLQSPLEEVGPVIVPDKADPLSVLSKWQQSLKEVRVLNALCLSSQHRFTNVTVLNLDPCSVPLLCVLVPAFPKLGHLTISSADSFFHNGEDFMRLHAANVQYQRDHPTQVWSLKSFSTDITTLHILGLQCTIPCVTISDFCPPQYSEQFRGHLQSSIAPFKPLEVTLIGFSDPPADAQGLADIFVIDKGMDTVKRLNLSIIFTSEVQDPKEDVVRIGLSFRTATKLT